MRLILIGCEYAGKTTLAVEISRWMIEAMGLLFVRWHNHFVVPHLDQHLVVQARENECFVVPGKEAGDLNTVEEEQQILALRPLLLEQFQRHMIWRHLHPDMYRDCDDTLTINGYYADAVYAPLYYGYGEPGTFADRRRRARAWDGELLRLAPDTVLVMVKASADVIRQRMLQYPRPRCILKERDVQMVLDRFQEEYDNSLISRSFTLDTTGASVEGSLQEFLGQMWQHLSQVDRLRMVSQPDTSYRPSGIESEEK